MPDNILPPTPAGWYPDPTRPDLQRYWDGSTWTEHTAPAAVATPTAEPLAKEEGLAPTPPPYRSTTALSSGTSNTGPTGRAKWWVVGAGAALLILVVGISVGAGNRTNPSTVAEAEPVVAAEEPIPAPTPTTSATQTPSAETAAPPAPEPAPVEAPVINAASFIGDANSQLDDVDKDLNDMIITLNEDGFWRLLSNYGELSFNLGQLKGLSPTPNLAGEWSGQLTQLEASFDAVGDSISTDQPETVRAAVESAAVQSAVLREIATRSAQ